MSWTASAWAKKTRGHRSHGCGRLLLVLADYHNDEANIAWPSQDTLAADCEMPKRTVQWCLAVLEKQGFITTLRKGNQYKTSMYRLNFNVLTPLNDEGGESEGVSLAPSNEGARWSK